MFIPCSTLELGHNFSISLNVLPNHPAFVAYGLIVLPDKSFLVKNVLIAGTGLYHHINILLTYS